MSESKMSRTLAFEHWQVRDAVAHLCYLNGPRAEDGRGDRWPSGSSPGLRRRRRWHG